TGNGALIKSGSGTFALTVGGGGTAPTTTGYTGPLTVSGGVFQTQLIASDLGGIASLSLNGGTLRLTGGAGLTTKAIDIGTNGGTISNGGTGSTFNGSITGAGALTVNGSVFVGSTSNTWSGGTT